MEIVEFGPLSEALRAELQGEESDPFESDGTVIRHWRSKSLHLGVLERAAISEALLLANLA